MSFFHSIYQCDVSSKAVAVYMNLRDRCGVKEVCHPSIKLIMHDTKLSRRTIFRALDELEKAGIIERIARVREDASRSSSMYKVKKLF